MGEVHYASRIVDNGKAEGHERVDTSRSKASNYNLNSHSPRPLQLAQSSNVCVGISCAFLEASNSAAGCFQLRGLRARARRTIVKSLLQNRRSSTAVTHGSHGKELGASVVNVRSKRCSRWISSSFHGARPRPRFPRSRRAPHSERPED